MKKEDAQRRATELLAAEGAKANRTYSRIEIHPTDESKPDGEYVVEGRPFGDHRRRVRLAK